MQKNQTEIASSRPGLIKRSTSILKSGPDISTAARAGSPTMTPASESGDETLTFGPQTGLSLGVGSAGANTATVETVTPGSANSLAPAAGTSDAATDSAQPATDAAPADPSAAQPAATQTPAQPADKSQESTSKKKKGIHKVLPF